MNKKKFEYKWVIVGICTLMVCACLGFCNSAKSLYVGPVSEALNIKRSVFSLNDTIRYLSTALANLFFGKLIAKYRAKTLIMFGFICVAAASVIFSVANVAPIFFIGSFLLGVGLAFTTTTMVGKVVNRWFNKGKGTIMGFVLASSGVGGAIASKVLAPMIYQENNPLGYKDSYMLCALIVAIVGVLALFVFKENPPEPIDTSVVDSKTKKRTITWDGIEYSQALKRPYFIISIFLVFLSGVALQGMSGSAATHIKDVGVDADFVATTLSINLVVLAVSKFLTGFLYDKFGLRTTVIICSVTGIMSMLILTGVTDTFTGKILSLGYGIIGAFALPMETVLIPLYASDLLGQKSFDKALGVYAAVNTAGFALGAPIINGFYDATGTYKYGFLLFATIMIVVLIGFQFVINAAHKERKKNENQ